MSRTCGQMIVHELLVRDRAGLPGEPAGGRGRDARADQQRAGDARPRRELITLPVVVHVVYRTDEENVSDEQVASQIDVLNRDFRAANEDRAQVPGAVDVAGRRRDDRVHARATSTRTQTDVESFGADDTVKSPDTGGIAPVAGKLNLWCCSLGQGLLGYAQFPGGPPETDGVVILNTAFGTTGTRRGAVPPRPHRGPRGRPLARPAPHLGRHERLHRRRLRGRHAARPARPTPASRRSRTSPATTAPTATCS